MFLFKILLFLSILFYTNSTVNRNDVEFNIFDKRSFSGEKQLLKSIKETKTFLSRSKDFVLNAATAIPEVGTAFTLFNAIKGFFTDNSESEWKIFLTNMMNQTDRNILEHILNVVKVNMLSVVKNIEYINDPTSDESLS